MQHPPGVICPLCAYAIPFGPMLAHKSEVHGERQSVPGPTRGPIKREWKSICQGGLPSLGRRRK